MQPHHLLLGDIIELPLQCQAVIMKPENPWFWFRKDSFSLSIKHYYILVEMVCDLKYNQTLDFVIQSRISHVRSDK